MRPKPEFNPWPGSTIPWHEQKASFQAELNAWSAEAMLEAAGRIEAAVDGAVERLQGFVDGAVEA